MLNVLLIYYEPIRAGQTTHVLALARGLKAEGHRVTVVMPDHLTESVEAFAQVGVAVVSLPLRKLVWEPGSIAAVVRLIRRKAFDVVHIHSQEAGLPGRVVARVAGSRSIVYTPQVIDIRRAKWHWLYVFLERVLAAVTDTIVSVSAGDRERMIDWGIPPHKIVTIPNGVDLRECDGRDGKMALRRELGLEPGCSLVMQVGRLSAQKDPLTFVEGAAQVVEECPSAQFVLMGDGPLKEAVSLRARELGLEGVFHLPGWRDDASGLMGAADVVTLTSRWEGMPHTLLEAMACSRPVVSTAVNGCPEVVAHGMNGFLVPPGDVDAWASRVVELLEDPEMRKLMGRRGRERLEEDYSMEGVVARIEGLYRRVACAG